MARRIGPIPLELLAGIAMAAFVVLVTPLDAHESQRVLAGAPRNDYGLDTRLLLAGIGLTVAGVWRWPVPMSVLSVGGTAYYFLLGYPGGPVYAVSFVTMAAVASSRPIRQWLPVGIAETAVLMACSLEADDTVWGPIVTGGVWMTTMVLFGEFARQRREERQQAIEREQLEARMRAQASERQAADERVRIARDVHDVVGHALATIALQAGVAERLMDRDPEASRAAVRAVREVSGRALGEIRGVLGLQPVGSDVPPAPTPDLDAIGRLVETMRDAGLAVDLQVRGEPRPVPDLVAAAGYRIVQEALTNAVRHAGPGANVRVALVHERDALEVAVDDDGSGRTVPDGLRRGPDASRRNGTAHADAASGTGVNGMRERALALGGRFEAGHRPPSGFRVWARLPVARA